MAEIGLHILFLADQILGRDEINSLRALFQGLEQLGYSWRLICCCAEPDHGFDSVVESRGLSRRWQRPWAIRGLDLGAHSTRPRLLHVLSANMDEIGLEISERWRIPYVLSVDEFPRRNSKIRLSRFWCRGLIAINHELAAMLNREFHIPATHLQEIARAVTNFGPQTRRARAGRVPVIGSAGPLVTSSGFSTFLNAARKVIDSGVDAEFLIAGHGEDEADLRRRADRLRIAERLTIADEIPDGLTFWDVLDVYCQTSVSPTVGRSLLLAMASGVPSIATDVEGLRSHVREGETGLIVPHGDSNALAHAILKLLEDHDLSERLGEAGRREVRRSHDPSLEIKSLDLLYRGIVEAGLGPRDVGLENRASHFDITNGLDSARVAPGSSTAVIPGFVPEV